MGMFDEVLCNHELFGVHKGETHQTKDLHWLGGALEKYEITSTGRLVFLEYTTEDRSDTTLEGIARLGGSMTMVFTGGRRDLNYEGWLKLSCLGLARFFDGTMVEFQPEPNQPIESVNHDEAGKAGEERGEFESDPNREFRTPIRSSVIGKTFRMSELPRLDELDAFVDEISSAVRSELAWQINKSLGLDTNAIRQLLNDK